FQIKILRSIKYQKQKSVMNVISDFIAQEKELSN
ncbi:unnamed protein product, partial [marine sediment metagenome]